MLLSSDRILTTHVGSLPRGEEISELLIAREAGDKIDAAKMSAALDEAVRHVVAKQKEAGVDIGNDGEQQRVGFQTYIPSRMTGFAGESKRRRGRDYEEFPELLTALARRFPKPSRTNNAPEAQGDIHYTGDASLKAEIARFKGTVSALDAFPESFMTAPSPGICSTTLLNAYYPSHEAYLAALARELAHEYRAIVEAGLVLQIDAPDLAMDRAMFYRDLSDRDFVKACELHVASINQAIEGLPADRIRLHVCWGNWDGPHIHDVPLEQVLPALYQAKVGALSIEFSNPRHAHEYDAFKKHKLPQSMALIPGVVDSTNNFVEHPQVVARRLLEAVAAIGDRERVIAGADCGFGTFTAREWVIAPVVWLKLKSIREGADIASRALWGKSAA
ncbi:MAG TPA: cobalamin-independent methionine synthase II family protein [Stellaceae bacterium]|nr:cobalamin-independent methionine synthase II family protein [Stellaceae bacterium]